MWCNQIGTLKNLMSSFPNLYVLITELWASNGIWNPWPKCILSYFLKTHVLEYVFFICCRLTKSGSSWTLFRSDCIVQSFLVCLYVRLSYNYSALRMKVTSMFPQNSWFINSWTTEKHGLPQYINSKELIFIFCED